MKKAFLAVFVLMAIALLYCGLALGIDRVLEVASLSAFEEAEPREECIGEAAEAGEGITVEGEKDAECAAEEAGECAVTGAAAEENDAQVIISEELKDALLLEELLEKHFSESREQLKQLSSQTDAVGYKANLALARGYREKGEGAAADFYRKALSLYDCLTIWKELATYLEQVGRYEEAQEDYFRMLPGEDALEGLLRLGTSPSEIAGGLAEGRDWRETVDFLGPLVGYSENSLLERYYVYALVRVRRYEEALPRLERIRFELPSDPEIEWGYARSLEAAGRFEEALPIYGALGEKGNHRRGRVLERLGRLEDAAAAYVAAPEQEARWHGARLWETIGKPQYALPIYMDLAEETGTLQDDAAYRVYILLSEEGDLRADDFFEHLLTIPAWAERLGEKPQWRHLYPELPREEPPFLKRIKAYHASGREELARLEFEIAGQRASLQELLSLGEWLFARGRYFEAARLGTRVRRERPCVRAYRLAFLRAYKDFVWEAAEDFGLDPYLLLAVMRQESFYQPEVVSWADARGLMQIMPATGEEIASRKGLDFDLADLFDPRTNVRFGAWYLRSLLDLFNGDLDRALAAYNGGRGNVSRWSKTPLGQDPATFPTAITFRETREYITKVRNSHLTYLWLYDGDR